MSTSGKRIIPSVPLYVQRWNVKSSLALHIPRRGMMNAEAFVQFTHLLRRELKLKPLLHSPQRMPVADTKCTCTYTK